MTYARGTVDPVSALTFLMEFRDADLNVRKPTRLGYSQGVTSDPPAWWQIKKKKTRDWTGNIDARSTRIDMVNLLSPVNSAAYIKKHEAAFADISAFLLTVEAPRYPFPIDTTLAGHGRELFGQHCAKCHGTYGTNWTYPNKIVPLDTLGTDRTLAESLTPQLADHFNRSWFAQEKGPDGQVFRVTESDGYQAPPLDGVWATAPYFHNASVPTVYHVLNSKARPQFWTRSYRTGKEDYDPVKLGWKITALDRPADPKLPGRERRKVYDTTQRGRSNSGHTFGDKFTEEERQAVIEYLKTL
jgi:mono/diheme cytochrome c family protein